MPMSDSQTLSTFSELVQWGQDHYRDRTFNKDDFIPTRPGLLYFVHQGAVRLTSRIADPKESEINSPTSTLLGLIGADRPFEILSQQLCVLEAYAHVDQTAVVWFYWNELIEWPNLQLMILEAFRRQHQFQLSWFSLMGQKTTLERLLSFLAPHPSSTGQRDRCN
jgi:CRP-like cAMP-binding protein